MFGRFRAHVRQQFVGYLALFVALSGTAYAAATIGPSDIKNDAVLSRHVKDGEVGTSDIAPSAIGTGRVRDGSLLAGDLAPGQLPVGARSLDFHLDADTFRIHYGDVGGVSVHWECAHEGGSNLRVRLVAPPLEQIYVIGTVVHDGKLEVPHVVRNSPGGWVVEANGSFDINVIARSNPNEHGWASFHLAGGYGAGQGCNYGGIVMPPSN